MVRIIKLKTKAKTVCPKTLEGFSIVREEPDNTIEYCCKCENELKKLDELLEEVLSEMTDEEFDEAWNKVKNKVDNNGTGDQIL